MSYNDYGGFSYKNGKKIISKNDCLMNHELYHAMIGDQDILIGLYKQSSFTVWEKLKRINIDNLINLIDFNKYSKDKILNDVGMIDISYFLDNCESLKIEYKDYKIEIEWKEIDNYYITAKIIQPNKDIWTGFSGYGVGNGFDTSTKLIKELV